MYFFQFSRIRTFKLSIKNSSNQLFYFAKIGKSTDSFLDDAPASLHSHSSQAAQRISPAEKHNTTSQKGTQNIKEKK